MKITGCRRQLFFRVLTVVLVGVPACALLGGFVWVLALSPGGRFLIVNTVAFIGMLVFTLGFFLTGMGGFKLGERLVYLSGWKDRYYIVRMLFGLLCLAAFTIMAIVLSQPVGAVWESANAWARPVS